MRRCRRAGEGARGVGGQGHCGIGRQLRGRDGEQVRVLDERVVEPVLEVLTEELGAEFDRTHDEASLGWREFTSSNVPWLRVDAELRGEGTECRRVIVGYEQKPVYKIRCGDEAAAPDAAPPQEPEVPLAPTAPTKDEGVPF